MKRWWHLAWAAIVLGFAQQATPAQPGISLARCIDELRRELPSHPEVKPRTFDTHLRDVADLRPMIERAARAQPEFQLPVWDYLARRVDAQRVAQGLELLEREDAALRGIAQRHGVDAATTVAIFGVETDYGRVPDTLPVVDATLGRACLDLKSAERKNHFFAALWLLQEGVVQPAEFKGSWAGAFGLTQFMPGTFVRTLSDGPGMPAADIVHSVPDALATTARYLRSLGWQRGLPWGVEVMVPMQSRVSHAAEGDHACLTQGRPMGKCRNIAAWHVAGVTLANGDPLTGTGSPLRDLPASMPLALLRPASPQGPAWLVTANFHALWAYNHADAYALAIGLLSDQLRRGPTPRVAWPTDDPGLSRTEFRELQGLLRDTGHCDVVVDGAEGPRTRAAIRDQELRLGLPATGRPGTRVLTLLRQDGTTTSCVPSAERVEAAASEAAAAEDGERP